MEGLSVKKLSLRTFLAKEPECGEAEKEDGLWLKVQYW
tara:strand:+ start:5453 stop:5566 length:114 start_codon:yes stop_codon:yes gene_type:complete